MTTKVPNPYQAGTQRVIPATLIYLNSGADVLMLHRAPGKDAGPRKWNGLGGKLDFGESPLEGACREIEEEAGVRLPLERLRILGFLQFPNFRPEHHEDWLCFVMVGELNDAERAQIEAHPNREEGLLAFVPRTQLLGLPLWPGDRHFLPWVLQGAPFWATLWYRGGLEVERVLGPFPWGAAPDPT